MFRPGAGEFFVDDRGCNALNIWVKPTLVPVEGDVTPFLGHVEYLLNGDSRMIDHQLDFLAHLVQHPEIKMKSTILIVGPPGVGKTFIAEWMVPLLGEDNVAFIDSNDLENQFNGYMDGRVLVVVNELISLSKKASNKLKSYITDAKMTINRKNIPTYDYNNCANFLLYSNYEDAAKIDTGDRRFAIEISRAMTREPAYYVGLWHWFENGGAQHLLHFLQTRNLDKFKPFAAPPVTPRSCR
jgi:putative DNA primase/helicase